MKMNIEQTPDVDEVQDIELRRINNGLIQAEKAQGDIQYPITR